MGEGVEGMHRASRTCGVITEYLTFPLEESQKERKKRVGLKSIKKNNG